MNERELFIGALQIEDRAERAVYLDRVCAGDADLRQRVEALLAAFVQAGSFLQEAAAAPAATSDVLAVGRSANSAAADGPGTVIGPYKLLQPIGEGGMGVVFLAQQTQPVERKVALKLIKSGMDSRQVIARFEAERQALALMDHPNIAKVHDAGTTENGRPYFVMELVKGVPITRFCDERRLTPKERLELFVPVCQAVQHAHQKGIIHRDLKPSNVMVCLYDGKPVPKVIDFGIAKATGPKLTEKTLFTEFGSVIGTLEYMSPEQAELNQLDIDTRSDIYALGVLLYELLTGTTPLERKRFKEVAFLEVLRLIREEETPRPSTRLSTTEGLPSIAANRGLEPKKLSGLMRGELDWIVMRALEKDRNRRYESASAFAADVQRYLDDEPVLACPPSAWYRVSKFLRRNRGPVLAASLLFGALVAGIVGTTIGLIRAERGWAAEAAQRRIAELFRDRTLDALRATTGDDVEKLIGAKKNLGATERAYLEAIARRWQAFAEQEGEDEHARALRGEGHLRVAYLWEKLGRMEEARVEYDKARTIQQKLVEQFPATSDYQGALALMLNNLGNLLAQLGQRDQAQLVFEQALDLRQKLAEQFPYAPNYRHDLAQTLHNLGNLLGGWGRRDKARLNYEKARDILQKLAEQFPTVHDYQSALALVQNNLGNLLSDLGERKKALVELVKARDTRQKLAEQFPALPEYQEALGKALNSQANLLRDLGQWDDARLAYERARDIEQKLAGQFPAVPEYQNGLARAHHNLANLLSDLGKNDRARMEYEKARDLFEKLAAQSPALPEYQRDLALTRSNLGIVFADLGQRDKAQIEFEKARNIWQKLADQFPAVPEYQRHLAGIHNNLGILLRELRRWQESRAEHSQALSSWQKLVDRFPDSPLYRVALAGSYEEFGKLVRDEGKPGDSLEWFGKAIATLTPVLDREPREVTAKLTLRNTYWARAIAEDQLRKYAEALKDWDKAIELSPAPEQARFRAARATSRVQAGQVAEALAEVAALTKAGGWNGAQWYDFACAYAVASGKSAGKKLEYADRAIALLQKAVRAGYRDAAHMAKDSDLDSLRKREDFKKLLAALQDGEKKAKQ